MLDRTDALSASEVSEWGDPLLDPEDYRVLSSYAPYDNVVPNMLQHTSILITAGFHDARVPVWHSLKYAARIRSTNPIEAQTRLVLQVYETKGHLTDFEESRLEESSLEIAYILKCISK
jgi:oligopeptidase B